MNKQGDYGLKFNIPSMGTFEKRIQFVVKNLETGAFFSSVFFKQCDYFMRISINMFIFALYSCFFNQGYLQTGLLHFNTSYASLSWA